MALRSEPLEFDCEGCGFGIVSFGSPPSDNLMLCAICAWLTEHERPDRIMETRRRCEPGGWIRERTLRAYRDPSLPERACDYCGKTYRGPAVYCSLECALADQ